MTSEQSNNLPSQSVVGVAFATLTFFKDFLTSGIFLQPAEVVNSFLPKYHEMFSSKSFNPETDISDLSEKVILVTGGLCRSFPLSKHPKRNLVRSNCVVASP